MNSKSQKILNLNWPTNYNYKERLFNYNKEKFDSICENWVVNNHSYFTSSIDELYYIY